MNHSNENCQFKYGHHCDSLFSQSVSLRMRKRGAFIVVEGIDFSGKTTLACALTDELNVSGIPTSYYHCPGSGEVTKELIGQFLDRKVDMSPETSQHLFVANRWEVNNKVIGDLRAGKCVVVDRYTLSGLVYSAMSDEWTKAMEKGLSVPDLTLYMDITVREAIKRRNAGSKTIQKYDSAAQLQQVLDRYDVALHNMDAVINLSADGPVSDLIKQAKHWVTTTMRRVENTDIKVY